MSRPRRPGSKGAAELGDRLGWLEKRQARLRISRIVGPGLLGLTTVVVATGTGDPVLISIMIGAFVGVLVLYRWSAARLAGMRRLTEEEFDLLTRTLPASPSIAGRNPREPGV